MQSRREFVRQLVRFRKSRGMTQLDLAKAAGISQQQISNIETGRSNPHLDTLLALMMGFGGSLTIVPSGKEKNRAESSQERDDSRDEIRGAVGWPPSNDVGRLPRSRVAGLIVPDEDDDAG